MKIAWICGLFILLSLAGYNWHSVAVIAAAEPMIESRDLSAYVHLHRTRNDSGPSSCY